MGVRKSPNLCDTLMDDPEVHSLNECVFQTLFLDPTLKYFCFIFLEGDASPDWHQPGVQCTTFQTGTTSSSGQCSSRQN